MGADPTERALPPSSLYQDFTEALPFVLDEFQEEALAAYERGDNLVVSAPTGSGKTIVANFAIAQALAHGRRAFYTTPLKALSNQKFAELRAIHGKGEVGLLTGDVAINGNAAVVVMTTEVLRNMLFSQSQDLSDLEAVILDEVHFIQDPYRGGVWEEVLILAPNTVRFTCLSATVANASELAAWISTHRGHTSTVISTDRPIDLHNHLAFSDRYAREVHLIDLLEQGKLTDAAQRMDQAMARALRHQGSSWTGSRHGNPPKPYRSPMRSDLVESLEAARLLPAICFIFSRAGCDDAVRQCLRAGLRLTSKPERMTIRAIVEHHVDAISDEDLATLGYTEWLEGLEAGFAPHHAGLVPPFREAVEELFTQQLVKVVFATETLAVGINMPARTVVIERFSKFGASGSKELTSGEFAQLSGRAGRRGLDHEGHAVVAWSSDLRLADVGRTILAPPPNLRSAFRPTYNLACNLMQRFSRDEALELLGRSFAQYQASNADRTASRLAERLARRVAVLEELGYADGWSLNPRGSVLAGIYHESDLVLAEALNSDVLKGAEPAVLAGLLSALCFEQRRARPRRGRPERNKHPKNGRHGSGQARSKPKKNHLGGGRLAEIHDRLELLSDRVDLVHAAEEAHLVPRCKGVDGGAAIAVASWSRGALLEAALTAGEGDDQEIAAGDFVRLVKQVADLCGQVRMKSPDRDLASSAGLAQSSLLRSIVATGGLSVSPT